MGVSGKERGGPEHEEIRSGSSREHKRTGPY